MVINMHLFFMLICIIALLLHLTLHQIINTVNIQPQVRVLAPNLCVFFKEFELSNLKKQEGGA